MLGSALFGLGELHAACDTLNAALEVDPEYVDALCDLGSAYMALLDNAPALRAFQQALALDPGHLESMYNLANLYRQMEHFAQVGPAACLPGWVPDCAHGVHMSG